MAILHEDIQFSDDEPSWQKSTLDLVSHEMSHKTKSVRGVGGRWHTHPELQLTGPSHEGSSNLQEFLEVACVPGGFFALAF